MDTSRGDQPTPDTTPSPPTEAAAAPAAPAGTRSRDRVSGLVMGALGAAAIVHLAGLEASGLTGDPGPRMIPGIAAVGLVLTGLALLLRPEPVTVASPGAAPPGDDNRRLTAQLLLIIVGYVALLTVAGYFIATPLFILAGFWLLSRPGEKILVPAAVTAAVVTAGVGLIFAVGLDIVLPEGMF
ncbi:tripartite tricarboxylate transporter TctB family protein [Pseudonocardia nematodicida]|uniref:Tripartite tricarboxylate transporter TctB family protein n=1 Tax=Pseudonocardia nematodicida TaxID=1206997 RepID=A0ABV1KGA6_9PSEU